MSEGSQLICDGTAQLPTLQGWKAELVANDKGQSTSHITHQTAHPDIKIDNIHVQLKSTVMIK